MSRDILFYTLAICAAILTGFVAWFFFYVVKIFKTVAKTVEDFRDRLATIDDILQAIKEKLTSTHLQLTALSAGLKEVLGFFAARRAKRRSSTRASTSADDF